ncbi:MAG: outer membrane beta-barrel protein [Dysgonamonadaceae bacterium]|nr:outer membrane beta-barrel protein [Dysgonamonadaceae bacterium]
MKAKVFLFALLNASLIYSQNSITGKISDKESRSLEYVNVILLSSPDSAFVSGAYTDAQGCFSLEKPDKKDCILKVSYIGYEDCFLDILLSREATDIGTIPLTPSANMLKEVVVTTGTPPFKLGNNGLIANVSTTLLSGLGTATDVIQRIPGIMMTETGITVFGKGAPIVYINNRKVQDNQELERLESSDISTIELITAPGAGYDAEGRAVLLVKTKKKQNGLSAQITERIMKAKYFGYTENINISYTKRNLHLFASYYHQYLKMGIEKENYYYQLYRPDTVWKHDMLMPFYTASVNSHQVSGGIDWSINDDHSIGGQYLFKGFQYGSPVVKTNASTYLNEALYDELHSQTGMNESRPQHLFNAFYSGNISDRFSLRFDFDCMKYFDDRRQLTEEMSGSENRTFNAFSKTGYDLYAGKLTNSYHTTAGLFEFGGEYNHIKGNGSILNPERYVENDIFSGREQKSALFISYSHTFGDIRFNAGLRYEFTGEKHTKDSAQTVIIDRKYSDIYPNLSISKKIKNVELSFVLNKRTKRPGFTELNGTTTYINRFLFQRGNPYLKKTDIYDAEVRALYKMFHLNAGYSYEKNPTYIYAEVRQENSNAILSTSTNYPKYQELNLTLNFSKKIAFWQPCYTANLCKPYFSANYNGNNIDYNQANYTIKAYNDFTLPLSFIFSCNFKYYSDYYYYLNRIKGNKQFDLSLRKSFFGNRLRLNLDMYDIFNRVNIENGMQINNLQWRIDKKRETRYVQLSITYLFNNYKKKYRGGSAAEDDINRF